MTHGRIQDDPKADAAGRSKPRKTTDSLSSSPSPSPVPSPVPASAAAAAAAAVAASAANETLPFHIAGLSPAAVVSLASSLANFAALHQSDAGTAAPAPTPLRQPPPLTALTPHGGGGCGGGHSSDADVDDERRNAAAAGAGNASKLRGSIWKCKRCSFK